MSDQSVQGIQNASDVYALVERTKEGWAHRNNVINDMQNTDNAALAAFLEELILVNTAQLKVMAILLERVEGFDDG